MIFRQLFEPLSSTYTYLLGCEETGQAVLIDPVIVATGRDLAEVNRLGLTLAYHGHRIGEEGCCLPLPAQATKSAGRAAPPGVSESIARARRQK
jgi:hypothetical protein